MKTLRKTAEEAYLKHVSKIISREAWIDGFISGIQYKKEYSQSIELCGLLWDTENLAIGSYEKDGRRYLTWEEAMDAAWSVGKRLPTQYEWRALYNLGSTWDDERKGRWFGGNHNSDHKGSLFLPANGVHYYYSDKSVNVGSNGYYWSSSQFSNDHNLTSGLSFGLGYVYPSCYYNGNYGFSVRCVQNK